jgi:hypothetical protein
LEAKLARPVSPKKEVWLLDTGPWWRLFRDHRGLDEAKVAILEAAWRLPLPLFLLPEKPLAQELEPFLRREATAWQIDRSKSAEAFYSTEPASGLGNWQLYAAKRPLTAPVPNTFRIEPDEVVAFMTAHDLVLLVDVFHDDTDWCIALREPTSTLSAA